MERTLIEKTGEDVYIGKTGTKGILIEKKRMLIENDEKERMLFK